MKFLAQIFQIWSEDLTLSDHSLSLKDMCCCRLYLFSINVTQRLCYPFNRHEKLPILLYY
jgi:hypothetical protein